MTCREALDKVLEAIKLHVSQHGESPKQLELGWEIAIDLCKCNRSEVGELAQETFLKGERALEERGIFGIPVVIDREHFTSEVRTLPDA